MTRVRVYGHEHGQVGLKGKNRQIDPAKIKVNIGNAMLFFQVLLDDRLKVLRTACPGVTFGSSWLAKFFLADLVEVDG